MNISLGLTRTPIRTLTRRWPAATVAALGLLAACGGSDDDGAVPADDATTVVEAPAMTAQESATSTPPTAAPSDTTDAASGADLDAPPKPDPAATADDHPDFRAAFDAGYQTASSYGRTDFYDPASVAEPGSMVGLAAKEAYRDGYALGLADYEAAQAEAEARIATTLDASIVGKVIEGSFHGKDWLAEQAGVDEECGAMVEAANPGVPCIDSWLNADRGDVIGIRLGDSGKEIDLALLVETVQGGTEVLEWWARADGDPLPDWAMPWNGMPDYLQ